VGPPNQQQLPDPARAIYEDPNSDEKRERYARRLEAKDDERGEFILLQ